MVPLKYNLRSLKARKVGSLMTIFGVGMVVWASIFAFGLYAGLEHTLNVSVNPLDVIVLRQGSTTETASAVSEAVADEILELRRHRHRRRRQSACGARAGGARLSAPSRAGLATRT